MAEQDLKDYDSTLLRIGNDNMKGQYFFERVTESGATFLLFCFTLWRRFTRYAPTPNINIHCGLTDNMQTK
jgi:hypothetical protein